MSLFRERFHVPRGENGEELVYLCGHSLGLQPRSAAAMVAEELEAWKTLGVEGHFQGPRPWVSYHEQAAEKLARLVGAAPGDVVAMNTLSVNLHLMFVSFYRPTRERYKILVDAPTFPSDRHAAASQIAFHGYDADEALVAVAPRPEESHLRYEDIEALFEREGERTALVWFSGVNYYSGQRFDLDRLSGLAHRWGCLVGFDLAHAVGNVPLTLEDAGADFAVWCHYKYVNGGPGAVGGAFVHPRHRDRPDLPRFAGWWGHDKKTRFAMGPTFDPIPGAEGWQLSNPPILSLAPVLASLDIFDEVGMTALHEDSRRLTGHLEAEIRERLDDRIEILTPAERGCQLSLRVREHEPGRGRRVFDRLTEAGIVCDWRAPDVMRAAPVPLYNRLGEVDQFVEALDRACR